MKNASRFLWASVSFLMCSITVFFHLLVTKNNDYGLLVPGLNIVAVFFDCKGNYIAWQG
jgi:hypothetical protein